MNSHLSGRGAGAKPFSIVGACLAIVVMFAIRSGEGSPVKSRAIDAAVEACMRRGRSKEFCTSRVEQRQEACFAKHLRRTAGGPRTSGRLVLDEQAFGSCVQVK